jgi:ribosomal protein S18 acetylase RimI-like enzyme
LADLVEREIPFSILYEKADGTIGRYDLQVTDVGRLGSNLYLTALAFNRGAARHFRLDRILSWQPYRGMNAPSGSDSSRGTSSGDRSLVIRVLDDDELHLLHGLWEAAGLEFRPSVRDALENLAAQWEDNPDGFIGAFSGDRLVGSVLATDDGRRGWINRVAVHPDYRRTGLGADLVRAAENELRNRGMRIIAALIEDSNAASRALFKKLEYQEMPEVLYYSKRDSSDV